MIVWDKGGGGVGSMWANCHELVYFGVKNPKAMAMKSTTKRGARMVMNPNLQRFPTSPETSASTTRRSPDGLILELLEAATEKGGVIWEPFSGSRTTLVACEKSDRTCLAGELEPAEAWTTTIRRWEKLTGGKAKRGE